MTLELFELPEVVEARNNFKKAGYIGNLGTNEHLCCESLNLGELSRKTTFAQVKKETSKPRVNRIIDLRDENDENL